MNYIYILYTQAPNIRYLQNKTWKWKSEINVQCCWCTPSLGWNQFAKRFVQEGHLYSVYLVYLVYREVEQKWEPQLKEKMYFSATACLMSKVKNINGLHVKYEQAEWEIKSWSWEALIIHNSPCFYSISTWEGAQHCSGPDHCLGNSTNWRVRTPHPPFSEHVSAPVN